MKKYFNKNLLIKLYKEGLSSIEIKERLDINISVRQIQRLIKEEGITRDRSQAFINAIKKGRMTFHTNPNKIIRKRLQNKIRYQVFETYGWKCCLCGNTAKNSRIEIDHIDNNKNNNEVDNLQVLCEECNKGKYRNWIEQKDNKE